jgi:chromate transporter
MKFLEIFRVFLRLGCTSFGGPVAHLGYLRAEFVAKRRWLTDDAYGDLVALCQFLPGPASSQTVFALGWQRGGWAGGLLASLGFTLPSAALMILAGCGLAAFGDPAHAGWLHGLKLAAVAVVAQAVWNMGRNLCPDFPRLVIALLAAAVLLWQPNVFAQLAVIAGGALAGWMIFQKQISPAEKFAAAEKPDHVRAGGILALFFLLLIFLPVLASVTGNHAVAVGDAFYRAGALVFGGGHVVLPLLRAEVVPPGWVDDQTFLAGYGLAQAVPGPLFTFAGYLGAVMTPGHAVLGGLGCLLAIFLPAWLLVAGALPFWQSLRGKIRAQAALRGANAAVTGVLLAALWQPVITTGVRDARDAATAVAALVLLQKFKVPPWLVVLLCAAAGQWLLK